MTGEVAWAWQGGGAWIARFGGDPRRTQVRPRATPLVVAGSRWVQPDGQVMFILVITLAAAEASIGLAILLQLYRRFHTLDIDAASEMRG